MTAFRNRLAVPTARSFDQEASVRDGLAGDVADDDEDERHGQPVGHSAGTGTEMAPGGAILCPCFSTHYRTETRQDPGVQSATLDA